MITPLAIDRQLDVVEVATSLADAVDARALGMGDRATQG
jgi:hypothetical protein